MSSVNNQQYSAATITTITTTKNPDTNPDQRQRVQQALPQNFR